MLSIEFSINVLLFVLSVLGSGILGYSLRSRQLKKKQFKIVELRKEMVDNHAQILELQKENVALERRFYGKAPVLDMKPVSRETEHPDFEILDSAI